MASRVLVEFETEEGLVDAWMALTDEGLVRMTALTPYPVRRLVTRLGSSPVPWVMLIAGILGGLGAYWIEWYCNAVSYPIDVAGHPLNSVPAFIPIVFETAVLTSSLAGFFGVLVAAGLPRLSAPEFGVEGFERASVDRFWLELDPADPRYDPRLLDRLRGMGALRCETLERGGR